MKTAIEPELPAAFTSELIKVKSEQLTNLTDEEKHFIFTALTLAYTRYNTNCNGNVLYNHTFNSIKDQNSYADGFAKIQTKLRGLL